MLPGLLLAASLLWCVYWFLHARGYWEDDAWIHLEFARSLAAGQGFSFNGHVVAGDTAPLWVWLLAAAHTLIPDWFVAGKVLTVFAALFGLAGIHAFARRLAHDLLPEPAARIFPSAMVLLLVANPYTCYWIFSGMETVAAAGLACWATLAATRSRATPLSFLAACLLVGIGPLLRPEMTFLAALLVLPLVGQWRRLTATPAIRFFCAAVGLVLLAGPSLAWSLYSLHAFGHLLPNTNAAKRAGPNQSVLRRLVVVYLTGLPVIFVSAIAAVAYSVVNASAVVRSLHNAIASALAKNPPESGTQSTQPSVSRLTLPSAAWVFILWTLIATLFYIANHTYVQTRYVLATAPGTIVVIFAMVWGRWPRRVRWLYVAAILYAMTISLVVVIPSIHNKAINGQSSRELALFIHDSLPPDAPVAVYSIGQIAFQSQHPLIDTGGITRPGAIRYLNAPMEFMAEWARSEGAQYYIGTAPPLPGSIRVFMVSTPYVGWTLHSSMYAQASTVSIWKLPAR